MIISDDVYGTFIHGFRSLMADLPYNTIGVYSYSKYFGVTGWRLGTIALHENNVFDKLIKELPYSIRKRTINICKTRKKLLFDSLDIGINEDENDASYYTQIDLLRLCKKRYGEEFVEYLKANYKPVDILFDLAQKSSIVLLGGGGFAGPEWSIRISLANLYDEAYSEIGVVLKRILDSYADDWKKLQG